jgi:hypothetical protein
VTVLITTTVVRAIRLGGSNRFSGEVRASSALEVVDAMDGITSLASTAILCFRSQADAASERSRDIKAFNNEARISN